MINKDYIFSGDAGEARGCSTNTSVIHSLINLVMVCEIYLRRRHALMVEEGAFINKTDCVTIFKKILNLKGHPNRITGSKVTAILLKTISLTFTMIMAITLKDIGR